MDVACSTFCFHDEPLDRALRRIAELEFTRVDLGVGTSGPHIRPEELVADSASVLGRIRQGPTVSVAGLTLRLDSTAKEDEYVQAAAHLAKQLATAVLTVDPVFDADNTSSEIERLGRLQRICSRQGVVLCALTKQGTATGTCAGAMDVCMRLPNLGLSLDPSHLLLGGAGIDDWDELYPYVRHVFLRDSSKANELFQTSVGRGEIDYSKVVLALQRVNYRGALVVDFEQQFGGDLEPSLEARKLGRVLESLL